MIAQDNARSLYGRWVEKCLPLHSTGNIKHGESSSWFQIEDAVFPDLDSGVVVPPEVLTIIENELERNVVHFTKALESRLKSS